MLNREIESKIREHGSQLEQIVHFIKLDNETYSSERLQQFVNTHTNITIKKGDYIFDKVVKIPSNRNIFIEEGTKITLKDGCNHYIFENEDLTNGNENISIYGGIYYGKGDTMTRKFNGATIEEDYYGFGLHFFKVKNLKLEHMQIYETNAWAIAHNLCDGVIIDDIFVWQKVSSGTNGDGVTGQSVNVKISNIRGYTNDDLVAFGAWGAQMGSNEMKIPKQNIENYYIENVEGIKREGYAPWKGIAIYQREGYKVNNVTVKNVKGNFTHGAVYFRGLNNEDDYFFNNINLENINGITVNPVGTIEFDSGRFSTVNITNTTQIIDDNHAYIVNGYSGYSRIKNLLVSGINIKCLDGSIIFDQGDIENITMVNCSRTSNTGNTTLYYRKSNSNCSLIPNVIIKGCNFTSINTYQPIYIYNGSLKISLTTTDFFVNEYWLSPKDKDIIFSQQKGFAYYYDGRWNGTSQKDKLIGAITSTSSSIITQDLLTKILFDRTITSDNITLSNGNITVNKTGFYHIICSIGLKNKITISHRIAGVIFKNNTESSWIGQYSVNSNEYAQFNGSCIISLTKGDTIDFRISSSSSNEGDRTIDIDGKKTYIEIFEI